MFVRAFYYSEFKFSMSALHHSKSRILNDYYGRVFIMPRVLRMCKWPNIILSHQDSYLAMLKLHEIRVGGIEISFRPTHAPTMFS